MAPAVRLRAISKRFGAVQANREVSFDVVSDFDEMELRNALDQVRREAGQRFDFKGAHVDLAQEKTELVLVTDDRVRAAGGCAREVDHRAARVGMNSAANLTVSCEHSQPGLFLDLPDRRISR